ncbi:MAG: hypothetical protein JST11_17460 [Acidobacteria bacterium]|nr:hypothetical protein [Acidobacteriota bacterium]
MIGLIGVAAAALLGGWVWTVPCLILCLALYRERPGAAPLAAAIAPGLFWLALFALTADRRLYFCYSMQYAVHLACLRREHGPRAAAIAGGLLMAVFVTVRVAQAATLAVLAVEIAVAAAVLALSLAMHGERASTPSRRLAMSAVASLLAFAGLAL